MMLHCMHVHYSKQVQARTLLATVGAAACGLGLFCRIMLDLEGDQQGADMSLSRDTACLGIRPPSQRLMVDDDGHSAHQFPSQSCMMRAKARRGCGAAERAAARRV
jgi:hypothetical protein